MRVVALNLQNPTAERVARLAERLLALEPDVALLSEFYDDPRGADLLERLAAGGIAEHVVGEPASAASPYTVAIAARRPVEGREVPFAGTPDAHRAVEARIDGITFVAVYFPLGREHHPFWDRRFLAYAATLADQPAVIGGDWNTGSRTLDIGGGRVPGTRRFDALLAAGWVDAWRELHPGVADYTWYSRYGNGFRLDHVLLSPSAPAATAAVHIHDFRADGLSDHSALLVDLAHGRSAGRLPDV